MGMTGATERPPELVVFCADPQPIRSMTQQLRKLGVRVDVVCSPAELRATFFQSGGHDVLVLSPDLTPSVARQAARSLCSVDPSLRVVAFGQELARQELPGLVTRVPTFHPSSRAALGSVLRVVRTLR